MPIWEAEFPQPAKAISDRMLHARVVRVLSRSTYLPDGILIASDTQRMTRLFHFTPEEIIALFDAFVNDCVLYSADGYADGGGELGGTRKAFATRA